MAKQKYQDTYQGNIIARFLDEEAMGKFHDDYCNHRQIDRKFGPPTKKELNIAYDAKKTTRSEAAQKHGIKYEQVVAALKRVAMYEFITKD